MSGTSGDFARAFVNGVEATGDLQQSAYTHQFEAMNAPHQNVGVHMFTPGIFNPTLGYSNAYRAHRVNGLNMHALFTQIGTGNSDIELLISEVRGFAASPQVGDLGLMFQGRLERYNPDMMPNGVMTADIAFMPGGKRNPAFPRLLHLQDTGKGSFTSTPVDMGAGAAGVALGAVGHLHIYTPTGVAATGNITAGSTPADGDTVVVGGTTYTAKTALTPTAGQFLIGGSAAAAAANLFAAMTGGDGAGTTYASGTPLAPSTAFYTPPTAANVIAVTFKATGTGGNAFTLVRTGTAFTVSGATLAGGVAGDTFTLKMQSATSSGGSYTDRLTFTSDGTVRQAERQELAVGVAVDRWWRLNATAGGSTYNLGIAAMFGLFYNI